MCRTVAEAAQNRRRPERELRGALPAAQCNRFERMFVRLGAGGGSQRDRGVPKGKALRRLSNLCVDSGIGGSEVRVRWRGCLAGVGSVIIGQRLSGALR